MYKEIVNQFLLLQPNELLKKGSYISHTYRHQGVFIKLCVEDMTYRSEVSEYRSPWKIDGNVGNRWTFHLHVSLERLRQIARKNETCPRNMALNCYTSVCVVNIECILYYFIYEEEF